MKVTLKDIAQRVTKLLVDKPHLRDDDDKLVSNIWFADLSRMGINPVKISAYKLLEIKAQGKLTNQESIRRSRQKIQAENPHLRGRNYKERKDNQVKIKKELKQ